MGGQLWEMCVDRGTKRVRPRSPKIQSRTTSQKRLVPKIPTLRSKPPIRLDCRQRQRMEERSQMSAEERPNSFGLLPRAEQIFARICWTTKPTSRRPMPWVKPRCTPPQSMGLIVKGEWKQSRSSSSAAQTSTSSVPCLGSPPSQMLPSIITLALCKLFWTQRLTRKYQITRIKLQFSDLEAVIQRLRNSSAAR